jgi:quercetin dioxygenase-like cupin family protein
MEGVTIETISPVYEDKRGKITDLLNEKINHVGYITTKKGETRGKHYHRESIQYSYILSGKFEVLLAKPDKLSEIEKIILNKGELITINPNNIHTFTALEDAEMIDMISLSREGTGYETDVVRVNF